MTIVIPNIYNTRIVKLKKHTPDCKNCKWYLEKTLETSSICRKFKYEDNTYELAYICREYPGLCGDIARYFTGK